MDPLKALSTLKDVDGVYGSFVVGVDGTPLFRDLPVLISNDALAEAGPRIAKLWHSIPEGGAPASLELYFSSHKLYIKKMSIGSLCVFMPPRVRPLALTVPVALVVRILEKHVEQENSEESDVPSAPSAPAPSAPSVPAPAKTIIYRGRRYSI